MEGKLAFLALGLSLAVVMTARGEVIKGVMSVTGAEMK
jgi:hypothetical protein